MAFSYVSYTGTGSLTTFAISFNYLSETVVVSADPKGIEVHLDDIKQTSGYTVNTSLDQVNFTTAPLNGVEVKILRVTPRGKADRLVDFVDGTILSENQLDTSSIQLLYIAQEAFEQSSAGGSVTPNYLPYDSVNGWWDAVLGGSVREIQNVKTGLLDNSVATKIYVDNVSEWAKSGVPQAFTFTNLTGLTNTFSLAGAPEVEENMLVVALSGALQVPGADFTVTAGSVNSDLVFTVAPGSSGSPLDLSVQNFGKMRFLDGLQITAGQVTTAAMDQTVGSEAVTTATMRDDAVTAAKIADTSVDLARINTAAFTTSSGTGTPRFLSVDPSSVVLGIDTLKTEDIEDFTTDVRAQNSINHFALPTATWSNNGEGITDLPATPAAGSHASSKTYVDAAIAAALGDAGMTKLLVHDLSPATSSGGYVTLTGWQDAAYKSYVIDIIGVNSSLDNYALGFQIQTGGSTWHTGTSDYEGAWVCSGGGSGNDGTQEITMAGNKSGTHGWASPNLENNSATGTLREKYSATSQLILPNNHSGAAWYKKVVAKAQVPYARTFNGSSNDVPGPGGVGAANLQSSTIFSANTATITGIRFSLWGSWTAGPSGVISAGAKFIIYGRTY